jgi:magnesium-protoporphyrin IX monomethyl ester (oxidative) cyclase
VNLDDPRFYQYLEEMRVLFEKMDVYKKEGGLINKVKSSFLGARAGIVFLKLYFIPVQDNTLPAEVRMVPSW